MVIKLRIVLFTIRPLARIHIFHSSLIFFVFDGPFYMSITVILQDGTNNLILPSNVGSTTKVGCSQFLFQLASFE